MKRMYILILAAMLLFPGCKKETSLTFTNDDIIVDLGSSDADVLKYVSASDKSEIRVSGIDYDKAGLQQGLFSANGTQTTHDVKICTDKLTGEYSFKLFLKNREKDILLTVGDWLVELTKGEKYNQVRFPCKNTKGTSIILNKEYLEMTFNGDSAYIPSTEGVLNFFVSTQSTPLEFHDIVYEKTDKQSYSVKGFTIISSRDPYTDTLFVKLNKLP